MLEKCPKRRLLSIKEEVFLFALCAEDPLRTNIKYSHLLAERYSRVVSSSFISKWFKNRFEYPADFKKPNVVPLDKWQPINVSQLLEYCYLMDALPMHQMWCFLDEKHIVNTDTIRDKARSDLLTGKMDHIPVSSDFRETYNFMAVVSLNPEKQKNIDYHINKKTNNSATFCQFHSIFD